VLLSQYAKSFNQSKGKKVSNKSLYEAIIGLPGIAVAKSVVKLGHEKFSDLTKGGLLKNHLNASDEYLTSKEFLLKCFQFRQDRLLHTMAHRLYTTIKTIKTENPKMDSKLAAFEGYNQVQDHSLNLARAYCENIVTSSYFAEIDKMINQLGESHEIVKAISALGILHALDRIERGSSWFLESKTISRSQIKRIRGIINELCTDLVPLIPKLVDAWGIPDFVFDETIASSKFNYEQLNAYDYEPKFTKPF